MNHYFSWLKTEDEFASLTSEQGWDDCRLDERDDFDIGLVRLDDGDDNDNNKEWQVVSPRKMTFADIVKRAAQTNGPFHKRQVCTFSAEPKIRSSSSSSSSFTQGCRNNSINEKKKVIGNNDNDDDDDTNDAFQLHILRKSRSRRRYQGDAWIFQHLVTILLRLGYGGSIQGDDTFKYHDPDALVPISDAPVDQVAFLRKWHYISKQDPEPEVDRLRKSWVKFLMTFTS